MYNFKSFENSLLNKHFKFLNVCNIFHTFLAGFWYEGSYINQHNYSLTCRSSHRKCAAKKDVLKKFCKFHRKTPVIESLFSKVVGLKDCNFTKKRLQHRCFPVKFAKFLRTPILKIIFERLLPDLEKPGLPEPGRPRGHRLPLIWIMIKSPLFNCSISSHVALFPAILC